MSFLSVSMGHPRTSTNFQVDNEDVLPSELNETCMPLSRSNTDLDELQPKIPITKGRRQTPLMCFQFSMKIQVPYISIIVL